ncbi:MAG: hypothetical protein K5985_07865 [Lachnospiraceae bacterium]|nr:hypothetical protein [Lachnospiraceae bacterium]
MGSEIAGMTFAGDIIHVTFYANAAAIILSLGVLVLCSKGVIRDPFEGKIFRGLLLATFCLTLSNGLDFSGTDAVLPVFLSGLIMTVNELLINAVEILWLCYVNYRIYRSRDFLFRICIKRFIPLFVIAAITFLNLFFGFLFYIDNDHVWHVSWWQGLCETIRFFYIIACIIQVSSYKKKHREFKFFTVAGFVVPMLAGTLYTALSPYSVIPLGFAIGLTNVYAGIINETSFLDRETGYFNRFYLRYLEADIRDHVIPVKSAMTYRLGSPEDMKAFSECLDPLLPGKCVMVRYNPTTVIMLAGVSDRFALRMMKEDAENGLKTLQNGCTEEDGFISIETFVRKKTDSDLVFYQQVLQKADVRQGAE